jgi:hypothetical protein
MALNLSQDWDLETLCAAEKQQTCGSLYGPCNSPSLVPSSFEMPSASMTASDLEKNFLGIWQNRNFLPELVLHFLWY